MGGTKLNFMNDFDNAVLRMRHFQNEYFATRDKTALKNAKFWEKHVDQMLKEKQSGQNKLEL